MGRRYDAEPKLNYKKVFGVIIGIAVVIMIIVTVINLARNSEGRNRNVQVSFFPSYTDGRWGVINSLGETVIEHTYYEMIVVPNRSQAVFIAIYDINEAEGTYRTKAINERGRDIITGFDKIAAIDNFDSRGNIWFEDDVLKVRRDGKYGLVNFAGEEVLPCEYDEIRALRRNNFKYFS